MVMVKTTEIDKNEREALLELSQRLYKLSGWEMPTKARWSDGTPVYDTTFLAERITPYVHHVKLKFKEDRFVASTGGGYRAEGLCSADAICSLAIMLVEGGEVPV